MTSKSADRSYRRSWKNLLINKRYQLRFTLFMVGLSAVLMVGLGIWVMWVANETTAVSKTSVRGDACPKVPSLGQMAPARDREEPVAVPPARPDEPGSAASDSPSAPPSGALPPAATAAPGAAGGATSGSAAGPLGAAAPGESRGSAAAGGDSDDEPRHVKVQIDESSMRFTAPPDLADRFVAHWTCELRQVAKFDRLERGRMRILWAMIATGIALVFGLALYGIKMTHRVAGPLFKVSLYLSKMREGRFDKVYNLRKGDQLVEFYDHFKLAHGGIVAMQQDDIARISSVIAAAESAGLGQQPAVEELRAMLARKQRSIE